MIVLVAWIKYRNDLAQCPGGQVVAQQCLLMSHPLQTRRFEVRSHVGESGEACWNNPTCLWGVTISAMVCEQHSCLTLYTSTGRWVATCKVSVKQCVPSSHQRIHCHRPGPGGAECAVQEIRTAPVCHHDFLHGDSRTALSGFMRMAPDAVCGCCNKLQSRTHFQ